jgi:putative ABC transport system permease protein
MFLRLVADSFSRRLSRKLLTAGALALGMAVATAALSVSLDVGDRLAREFRSLGANLLVTPAADSLPLEIGGVDYRPVNAGAYLPEADLGKLRTIFWRNNIVGFAPVLEVPVFAAIQPLPLTVSYRVTPNAQLIGTWSRHMLSSPDGEKFTTGVESTNPWWQVEGRWFAEGDEECVAGLNFAQKNKLKIGSSVFLYREWAHERRVLRVTGILSSGGPEDDAVIAPLDFVQQLAGKSGQYRKLYVSALTKPEDGFARRDPKSFTPAEYDRWFCTPYISAIALQIQQVLPGTDVRVIRRIAEGEGRILTRVRNLLWLVTAAALLAAALAVGATSAATILERRTEIGLMKALGAGRAIVKSLFAAEQIVLGLVGGAVGYALGILLARLLGQVVFGAAPAPSALIFGAVLALAIGVTLAGSAFSLRRAARVEPAPILRGE